MWNDLYRRNDYFYGVQPDEFIKQYLNYIKGPVLILAESDGRNTVYLATRGFEVLAVNAHSAGLHKAHRLARERNVSIETRQIDPEFFVPEPGKFRTVLSAFAHLPKRIRKNLHGRVMRALEPGAIVMLVGYGKNEAGHGTCGPDAEDMLYDRTDIEEEFSGCETILSCEHEAGVIAGAAHTEEAGIVQYIGRKT